MLGGETMPVDWGAQVAHTWGKENWLSYALVHLTPQFVRAGLG